MKLQVAIRIALILLATALGAMVSAQAADTDYKVVNTWKLGGDGGWDYLFADSAGIAYSLHGPPG